jgi:hypothetical protein
MVEFRRATITNRESLERYVNCEMSGYNVDTFTSVEVYQLYDPSRVHGPYLLVNPVINADLVTIAAPNARTSSNPPALQAGTGYEFKKCANGLPSMCSW